MKSIIAKSISLFLSIIHSSNEKLKLQSIDQNLNLIGLMCSFMHREHENNFDRFHDNCMVPNSPQDFSLFLVATALKNFGP